MCTLRSFIHIWLFTAGKAKVYFQVLCVYLADHCSMCISLIIPPL